MAGKLPKKRRGRPPMGPVTGRSVHVSARIPVGTDASLRREAKRKGLSFSQLVALRLGAHSDVYGFAHVRALAVMVARVVTEIEQQTGHKWHEDRFTFESVENAIKMLMAPRAPRGRAKTPTHLKHTSKENSFAPAAWQKPDGLAFAVTARFLIQLRTRKSPPRADAHLREDHAYSPYSDYDFVFDRLRDDLGIAPPPDRPTSRTAAAAHAPARTEAEKAQAKEQRRRARVKSDVLRPLLPDDHPHKTRP